MSVMHVCPLLSQGSTMDKLCMKEKCAWYMSALGACSIYLLAHDAALNIKEKQQRTS